MPPRYAYWTILAGGLPTAFRAAERDELLPTFKRIQEKHPDAAMKYFARGKLWESREDAQTSRDRRDAPSGPPEHDRRGRDWRPGGDHRDPRQKFKDAKKARNLAWRKERFDRHQGTGQPQAPPRPRGPKREPRPGEVSKPARPPRPSEPAVSPHGPPERGRGPRGRFPAGGRPPRDRGPRR